MPSPIIKVENLGKQYRIGGSLGRFRYQSLRDTIMNIPKSIARHFRGGHAYQDETIWALKDVSFEVHKGEVVGVIGKNGAGKTTLLKILSRITEPTEGYAELRGRVGSLLEVGTGFHPELTGRENVYLSGAILGMKKAEIERKYDEIVAFAELEKFMDTPVKRYSSGMYVRLAFAVAAHLEPEILLVDEVLAVGDVAFQKKCLGKMGEVAEGGRTVLFVSHNMGRINALCQKTILLELGSIVKTGKTSEVTNYYITQQIKSKGKKTGKGYKVNLEVINDRKNDDIEIKDIKIENPNEPELGGCTGDPLFIRIDYSSNRKFLSPAFVVSVKDIYGREIFRLSTMPISGYKIENLYNNGRVELLIKSLPLVAGHYYLDIAFVRERVEIIRKLENVIEFDVQLKDVYKSGTPINYSRGLIVVDHEWNHLKM